MIDLSCNLPFPDIGNKTQHFLLLLFHPTNILLDLLKHIFAHATHRTGPLFR